MHRLLLLLPALLGTFAVYAQSSQRPYEDERRLYVEVGVGAGLSKASRAYSINPLFLPKTRLGWQVYLAPQYLITDRINLGLRLGGVFRPKFDDPESNSVLQGKFTPYGLAFADYYLGSSGSKSAKFFLGMGVGATYIGELEARHNQTNQVYLLRRQERDVFLTLVPRAGVAFRDFKIQVEHLVTTPFNPDITSITISSMIPVGRPAYY
ncbi:hypothetical protein [Telluribacter sp.]|jgi:hypothetical protein|uniref:hypothetical protein n=1 Tax=Telluribacter sp. TaxID=1978767 RepID=UPI002E134E79|nr:hypothetical protein [Telluribacter sp.]